MNFMLFQAIQTLVYNSKTNIFSDVNESGIGRETAGHHGQSLTVQTEVGLLLPPPPSIIDLKEQAQMEQLIQDEHDLTEYISVGLDFIMLRQDGNNIIVQHIVSAMQKWHKSVFETFGRKLKTI